MYIHRTPLTKYIHANKKKTKKKNKRNESMLSKKGLTNIRIQADEEEEQNLTSFLFGKGIIQG